MIYVACNEPGGVFIVDFERGNAMKLWDQPVMGMCFDDEDPNIVWTAGRRSIRKHCYVGHSLCEVERWDGIIDGWAVHDIIIENNIAYVISPSRGSIEAIRFANYSSTGADGRKVGAVLQTIHQIDRPGADHCHLNSLVRTDATTLNPLLKSEDIFLFSAFAHVASDDWNAREGVIGCSKSAEWEVLFRHIDQPHSVRIIDGSVHYLESARGKLHRMGSANGFQYRSCSDIASIPGYAKGLAADDDFYYIGQCKTNHHPRARAGIRELDDQRCGVWKLNRYAPHQIEGFVDLPEMKDVSVIMTTEDIKR